LLSLVYARKKSRGKWDTLVILLVLGASVGMSLAACKIETTVTQNFDPARPPTLTVTVTANNGEEYTYSIPLSASTPLPPTGTPTPTCTTTPSYWCGLPVSTGPNETELNSTLDELVKYVQDTNQGVEGVPYGTVREQLHRLMKLAGEQGLNTNHLAYIYATVQVETLWRDFEERGNSADFSKYESGTTLGNILGNIFRRR